MKRFYYLTRWLNTNAGATIKDKTVFTAKRSVAGRTAQCGRSFEQASEVDLFRTDMSESERAAKTSGRRLVVIQSPFQFTDHGVQQVVRFETIALCHLRDRIESGLRPTQLRNRDRAVERDDRRRLDAMQLVIVTQDQLPVCRRRIRRRAVNRRDSREQMVFAEIISLCCCAEMLEAARDEFAVPLRAVLIVETEKDAVFIDAGRKTRRRE